MDLEDPPEPPHIKEEEEELWSSQEGEQLHGLEEADITKFTSTSVPVKSEEDDEEKPQSSQLHQTQTERIKTEADGEDCGGPEPARNSDPERHLQPDTDDKTEDSSEPDTDDSDDWTESREPQSGLNSKRQKKVSVSDVRCKTDKKTFICTECGKRFDLKGSLKRHLKIHTGEKPFNCSECGERFGRKFNLRRHIRIHTGEKPFHCSVCGKSFTQGGRLTEHMAGHTGEKPFSCSVCDRRFTWLYQLKRHKCSGESSKLREVWSSQEGARLQGLEEADITKVTVTPVPVKSEEDDEEKPQSSQLHQTQTEQLKTEADEDCGGPEPARNSDPERHLQPDTDDKTEDYFGPRTVDWKETRRPDSCLNSLKNNVLLVSDVRCRTGKNSFNCSVCGKRFSHNSKLNRHMRIHTGEKPFSCSLCSKSFTQKASLDHHLKTHTGEKPYSCSLCSKCYLWNADLEIHMRTHTGEKPYSCSFCNKCFSQYTHLQSHTRTHTGEKPLSCSVCHKRFTWHAQLKRHKCAGESSQLQELSTSQEGEQLQGLEEADITKFTSTSVPVKSEEDDEEKPQSSQLHQRQTEQLKTEADEDCGGPEPARNSDPERHLQPDADNKASVCLKNNDTSRNNVIFSTSEKSFSCFECGRIFPWKEDLVHHMEFHSGEKPYLCSICGRGFTQGQYLSHHMARHIKRFSCRLCDRRFTWLYQLKNHQCVGHELSELHQSQNEENRESEPPACSSTDTMNTKAHGEDVGGPKTTRSPEQERHLQPDTNDKTEDSSEPKTNDSDDWKESRQRQTRSNPQKNHEVPVSDIGCKTEEKSLSSSKCGKKPLRCSICGSGFTRKANLICHMKRHTGEKPFSCAVCKKLFRYRGDVQRHMKIHTRDKSFRKIMKSFSCSECGKGFSRKEHLIIHMRIHTGEKPYSCSLCNKCFSRGKYLQSHMRTHTGEKLFSCSVCGKRFGQKSHLQFHLKCHTGEKPYSCSLCKKCFLRNRDLERHMRTHTGEKPIICSVCDQKFSWHYQFKRHKCKESSQLHKLCSSQEGEQLQGLKKTHITKVTVTPVPVMSEDDGEEKPQSSQRHQTQTEADGEDCRGPEPTRNSDPEKRLQPDTDDKSEDWYEPKTDDLKETREPKSGLNSQKNNEVPKIDVGCRADKKPFNCSECGERFGRKFNLRRHIRIHTGEKPFNCSVCGKSFTQGGRLTEHMAGHTGEQPFSCSVCDRRFTWLYQLKKHKCSGESSKLREVWSSQEGERLQGLEEADITKVTVTPVSLKAEDDDEEKPQSS